MTRPLLGFNAPNIGTEIKQEPGRSYTRAAQIAASQARAERHRMLCEREAAIRKMIRKGAADADIRQHYPVARTTLERLRASAGVVR